MALQSFSRLSKWANDIRTVKIRFGKTKSTLRQNRMQCLCVKVYDAERHQVYKSNLTDCEFFLQIYKYTLISIEWIHARTLYSNSSNANCRRFARFCNFIIGFPVFGLSFTYWLANDWSGSIVKSQWKWWWWIKFHEFVCVTKLHL